MNARAAAEVTKIKRGIRRGPGKRQKCESYGCEARASMSVPWFDIFSDDPKGLVHVCDNHSAENTDEMFLCEGCDRVMIDHITWERYQVELDGRVLCLKCAAERYFADPRNWILPHVVQKVVLQSRRPGPLFAAETGVLNIARCKHVLGVKQPIPAGVAFVDNAEFDGGNGHQISGDDLRDVIKRLDQPFCPVLDAAYQFAVSIGIYVRIGQEQQQEHREAA